MTTDRLLNKKSVTVNHPPIKGEFSLYVGNPKNTVAYFAHEADRFASASFESLLQEEPRPELERSTGWMLIRGYYAAFFAMHALLRIHGWACTKISGTVVGSLNREIDAIFPGSEKVEGGLYLLESVSGGSEVLLTRMDATLGGSHEVLWSLLGRYMKAVTDTALVDTTDAAANANLAVAIDGFLGLVQKKGGPNWFTQVRNRVNYSHDYGAWFPYTGSSCDTQRIAVRLGGWLMPPETTLVDVAAEELIQFSAACSFIVSLCRTTVEDLVFRSITKSPFRSSSGRLLTLARQPTTANGR